MTRPYIEDPICPNEDDPDYRDEVFITMKSMGWKPEDLKDRKDQDEYAAWLETHSNEEE